MKKLFAFILSAAFCSCSSNLVVSHGMKVERKVDLGSSSNMYKRFVYDIHDGTRSGFTLMTDKEFQVGDKLEFSKKN